MDNRFERELLELRRLGAVAIDQVRLAFQRHGFDVADYDDDQVSRAILADTIVGGSFSDGIFARAYARLHSGSDGRRRGTHEQGDSLAGCSDSRGAREVDHAREADVGGRRKGQVRGEIPDDAGR